MRLPILLALAIAGGMLVGATMFGGQNNRAVLNNYKKFGEVLGLIERDYVDSVNTDDLVETAIEEMLEKLDPHTVYIPARDVEMAQTQLEGDFEGIGIEFLIVKDTINVVTPLSGGPSEQVGLRAGDKIVSVDGENVAGIGFTNRDVFSKLRGPKGSKVKLGIQRRGEQKPIDFVVTRDKIPSYSIDVAYMVDDQVGYLKVSRFAANTYNEFKEALDGLKAKGMRKLILDLRDNPGGYMDRATKMADELLSGNKLIVYTDGRGERFDSKVYAYKKGDFEEGPVIVLINEGSASASEIVAGALQDNDRALIVGRRSFGKGLVQMPVTLSDNSELRLTISRYYTPSGRSIQKPYEEGDEYGMDIYNRYEHGEFFHADSIKFNDSLRYQTGLGRTVYGGGGIMPDYFVPADTSENSRYLIELYNKNLIREYAMDYYDRNKKMFQKMDLNDFVKNYEVSDKMLAELKAVAKSAGIEYNEEQFQRSKSSIKTGVKAFIAKSVWRNEGFYPVFHQNDEVFQQAVGMFDKAQALETGTWKTGK